tara:strand:+ start:449 stop:685 length:237 start_codon:yes stop_codon:yes gene_type:complete
MTPKIDTTRPNTKSTDDPNNGKSAPSPRYACALVEKNKNNEEAKIHRIILSKIISLDIRFLNAKNTYISDIILFKMIN